MTAINGGSRPLVRRSRLMAPPSPDHAGVVSAAIPSEPRQLCVPDCLGESRPCGRRYQASRRYRIWIQLGGAASHGANLSGRSSFAPVRVHALRGGGSSISDLASQRGRAITSCPISPAPEPRPSASVILDSELGPFADAAHTQTK